MREWYKGQPGGYVWEYSDLLLMFRLKALRPEEYRERVEVRGAFASIDLNRLSDEQLARLAGGEHPLAVLATPGAASRGAIGRRGRRGSVTCHGCHDHSRAVTHRLQPSTVDRAARFLQKVGQTNLRP